MSEIFTGRDQSSVGNVLTAAWELAPKTGREEGGWIYMNRRGRLTARLNEQGGRNVSGLGMAIDLSNPPAVRGSIVVATFHTHDIDMDPSMPTGERESLPNDLWTNIRQGVPGIILGGAGSRFFSMGFQGYGPSRGYWRLPLPEEVRKMILLPKPRKQHEARHRSFFFATSSWSSPYSATTTYALLIIVTTMVAGCSCSSLNNQSSRNGAPLNSSLDFCELVRRPDNYDSKMVRVRSVLIGFHELALYNTDCDGQIKYIRADLDSKARNQLVQGVASLGGQGMQRGNFWVEVVAIGRFEKIPESDCKNLVRESGMPDRYYVSYCHRLIIADVERVETVPETVAWPR